MARVGEEFTLSKGGTSLRILKKTLYSASIFMLAATNRTPFGVAAAASIGRGDVCVDRRRKVLNDIGGITKCGDDVPTWRHLVGRGALSNGE